MATRSTTPPNNTPIVTASMYPTPAMALWMTGISKGLELGAVSSVNGETGAVALDTGDIPESGGNLYFTPAERAKLAAIDVDAIGAVDSVNGLTGEVILFTDHIAEDANPVNLWFTQAERDKLAGIEDGAQVNAFATIDGGNASGISPDYGWRVDGGAAATTFNPLDPVAGGQDANGN